MELVTEDEVENAVCSEVTNEEVDELNNLASEMIELCKLKEGIGMAAPQIGVNKKLIIKRNMRGENYEVIFNPSFYRDGGKTKTVEGCLSYIGQYYYLKRFKRIGLIYYFWNGEELVKTTKKAVGMEAFIWQHEIDHINGKTIAMKGELIDEDKITIRTDKEGNKIRIPTL